MGDRLLTDVIRETPPGLRRRGLEKTLHLLQQWGTPAPRYYALPPADEGALAQCRTRVAAALRGCRPEVIEGVDLPTIYGNTQVEADPSGDAALDEGDDPTDEPKATQPRKTRRHRDRPQHHNP